VICGLCGYLAEFDEADLVAAVAELEMATVPGCDFRLLRGHDLHRRQSWNSTYKIPPRAMLLDQVGPLDFRVFERSDLEPYLLPPE